MGVFPADGLDLNGIGKMRYHQGLYMEEGGTLKCLWLELLDMKQHPQSRGAHAVYTGLFACLKVSKEMSDSAHGGKAAGQGFEPRRGKPGYIVQGARPFHLSKHGWVWQEPFNGPVTFWFESANGETHSFKQWMPEKPAYWWNPSEECYILAQEAANTWHFPTMEDWAPAVIRELQGKRESSSPAAGSYWDQWGMQ